MDGFAIVLLVVSQGVHVGVDQCNTVSGAVGGLPALYFSGPKKTPRHKDFTKNPTPESTLFRGLQPPKFFVFGLCFLFEM